MRWEKNELQHSREFERFVRLLLDKDVRSYLEIGSRWGGSLWGIGSKLPKGSLLVAVERDVTQDLQGCVKALNAAGQNARIIYGDSRDAAVVDCVRFLSPFDAVLIDGSHDHYSVKSDWENYGSMARIVAFHDATAGVVTEKKPWKADVANFYNSIKGDACLLIKESGGIGFGIIWR